MANLKTVQSAANASWIAVLLQAGFNMLNRDDAHDQGAVVSAVIGIAFSVICYLAGLAAGVYALTHVKAVGRKGVLVPALIGTTLCFLALTATILMLRGKAFGVARTDVRSAAFLGEVASGINKKLPLVIDSETELAGAAGLEGVLVYKYRLVNAAAADLDVDAFLASVRPTITMGACTNRSSREKFLNDGVTLRFSYTDKSGVPIGSIDVALRDCGA